MEKASDFPFAVTPGAVIEYPRTFDEIDAPRLAACFFTASHSKPWPLLRLLTVPLFMASGLNVRQGDTQGLVKVA